jgi:hypothetical protein
MQNEDKKAGAVREISRRMEGAGGGQTSQKPKGQKVAAMLRAGADGVRGGAGNTAREVLMQKP